MLLPWPQRRQRGKVSDILLLDSNPLENISATREIRGLVLTGRLLDKAALEALLSQARIMAVGTPQP